MRSSFLEILCSASQMRFTFEKAREQVYIPSVVSQFNPPMNILLQLSSAITSREMSVKPECCGEARRIIDCPVFPGSGNVFQVVFQETLFKKLGQTNGKVKTRSCSICPFSIPLIGQRPSQVANSKCGEIAIILGDVCRFPSVPDAWRHCHW